MNLKKNRLSIGKESKRNLSFRSKLAWTIGMVIIYMAFLKIPIIGIPMEGGTDPFFIFRTITASNRGHLAEFGIIPIVSAVLIMQLLIGSKLIKVNFSDSEDRRLYKVAIKIIAIIITLALALIFPFCDVYGDLKISQNILIAVQLFLVGFTILLMDELLQRGYGLGRGVTLFIITSVSFDIFDGMFNLTQDVTEGGLVWFRGCILAFFQGIARGDLKTPFCRIGKTPDMFAFFMIFIVFTIAIYIITIKVEIPAQHRIESIPSRYPIRNFYTFYVPVILTSTFFSIIYFFSNIIFSNYPQNKVCSWDLIPYTEYLKPTGFFSIFSPPYGPEQVIAYPFQSLGYMLMMILFCGIFSRIWIKTAGMDSISIARNFLEEDMLIPGFREDSKTIAKYLNQYIPTLAWLGGFFMGFIAALFDFLGPLGTGTGILVTVCVFREYYELIIKERKN